MLYVVAWPVLAEADDTALRRLRAQYHAGEAQLIGPHFIIIQSIGLEILPHGVETFFDIHFGGIYKYI